MFGLWYLSRHRTMKMLRVQSVCHRLVRLAIIEDILIDGTYGMCVLRNPTYTTHTHTHEHTFRMACRSWWFWTMIYAICKLSRSTRFKRLRGQTMPERSNMYGAVVHRRWHYHQINLRYVLCNSFFGHWRPIMPDIWIRLKVKHRPMLIDLQFISDGVVSIRYFVLILFFFVISSYMRLQNLITIYVSHTILCRFGSELSNSRFRISV